MTPSPNHPSEGEKNIMMPWGRGRKEKKARGRRAEGIPGGARQVRDISHQASTGNAPSPRGKAAPRRTDKKRATLGWLFPTSPHSLLDRSTVPLLRPRRRPEEDAPRRRRRARVGESFSLSGSVYSCSRAFVLVVGCRLMRRRCIFRW